MTGPSEPHVRWWRLMLVASTVAAAAALVWAGVEPLRALLEYSYLGYLFGLRE